MNSKRKAVKHTKTPKRLPPPPNEIIVGPNSTSEEIWIDGIEYLPTLCINDENKEFEKDLSLQNPSSPPCVAEYNNNGTSKSNRFQVDDNVNEINKTNGIGSIK